MSEYQYYEFCNLTQPLSQEARKEMKSLSSRAIVTTHGASYVYNFAGGLRGDPKKLLLKYFDIYFYIANWGTVQLMFKFPFELVDLSEIKPYLIKDVISYKRHGKFLVLDVEVNNEDGFGWTEGEGILPILLPIYAEILNKNYQFLRLAAAINNELTGDMECLGDIKSKSLTEAHKEFMNCSGLT